LRLGPKPDIHSERKRFRDAVEQDEKESGMYVGRVMHTELVTISPDTSLIKAREILESRKIAHLLVVDAKKDLVGIVSDRDLKQNWASPAVALSRHELNYLLTKVTVEHIMVKKILTVSPLTTIERAALVMQQERIGALPVLDEGKLVGIITSRDVMQLLLEAIGIDADSRRLTVICEDRIGFLADMSQLLRDQGINIRSLFAWPDKQFPGFYHLVMRVAARDGDRAIAELEKNGYKVITAYTKDLTPFLAK
jgi:acetoin utilization protein AcuB